MNETPVIILLKITIFKSFFLILKAGFNWMLASSISSFSNAHDTTHISLPWPHSASMLYIEKRRRGRIWAAFWSPVFPPRRRGRLFTIHQLILNLLREGKRWGLAAHRSEKWESHSTMAPVGAQGVSWCDSGLCITSQFRIQGLFN